MLATVELVAVEAGPPGHRIVLGPLHPQPLAAGQRAEVGAQVDEPCSGPVGHGPVHQIEPRRIALEVVDQGEQLGG